MEIEVVVEIPKGTRNKYEADKSGEIWLDRLLFTATRYPEDYGYVPETLADDGDPVDAMVVLEEPTFPGCHIHARPVGVFRMTDEEGADEKVLCVPSSDPRWDHVNDISDLPDYELREIAHFFDIYKDLEPGKTTQVMGWSGREDAENVIARGRDRHGRTSHSPS
ncbi:MAG TPA: inorganic diphosphatase [Acidimicrobiales bacterium]|nr:inorganic diphosphatase [Acidimicrobiales bacterium]